MLLVVALAVVATGCPRARAPHGPAASAPDAPYELDDDLDLADRVDHLRVLPRGGERTALRREVAAALVRRLVPHLEAGRLDRVDVAVRELALLWEDEPAALPGELGPHLAALTRARAALARAGKDAETALVLALLAAAEPARAHDHGEELAQIVDYAEDLGRARLGALGPGTGTITVLAPLIERLPAPDWTDRYVTAVVARANLADAALASAAASGRLPDSPAIRAGFRASRDLAIALALAGRAPELAPRLGALVGVGKSRALEDAARAVAGPAATAADWAALARAVRQGHGGKDDRDPAAARAALALCQAALVRFPDDVLLLQAAAGHALDLDRLHQPIALLERARAAAPRDAAVADRLTALYRDRLARLAHGDRPRAAHARLDELRRFHDALGRSFPDHRWSSTWAEALAAYGRGLAAVGELASARAELQRSVGLAPTIEALETLGSIALKRGEYATARGHLERGARLGGDAPSDLYARAKVLRLAGDAAAGAGDRKGATRHWREALELWAHLGEAYDLPPGLASERFAEIGKLFWTLELREEALASFARALDADPEGAESHVQVVAYLLMHDELERARDAFYDALGSDQVGDYHKVYLCLWILAEDRRAGRADDRLAREYLAGRDGPLWYDDIARLATGRTTAERLEVRATTRGRRAELTYYRAVLGPSDQPATEVRRLLEEVVRTDMVLFFEYEMARRFLDRGDRDDRAPAPTARTGR